MVDCPTEDVPFREGAFGGPGTVSNAPGFPLLAPFGFLSGSHPLSLFQKENRPLPSRGVAGCATGSARPLGAQTMLGRASKPLRFVPLVPSLREDPNSHVGPG